MEWVKIYDLAEDAETVKRVQRATLESEEFGLMPEPALLGSPEWWRAVESGELESHWLTGVIRRPLWTGMNDYPEVEVQADSGHVSSWTRLGDVTQYAKGRRICIRWVLQKLKKSLEGIGDDLEQVLEVWLEGGAWRPTAEYGPGPGRSLDDGWEGGPA